VNVFPILFVQKKNIFLYFKQILNFLKFELRFGSSNLFRWSTCTDYIQQTTLNSNPNFGGWDCQIRKLHVRASYFDLWILKNGIFNEHESVCVIKMRVYVRFLKHFTLYSPFYREK
jgi:hypothetical protein